MKQLLILSGKGGTGKTTVASAFIQLANAKAYADCDVDAPNLHLVIHHKNKATTSDYFGLPKAEINPAICIQCDQCRSACRFDAISKSNQTGQYIVDPFSCEGCGVCELVCPVDAILLKPTIAGELMLFKNESIFSTAQLKMGSGTSGKLVTEVKKQLKPDSEHVDLTIIDGSPGIGCPVIASLSGVDMVLIVAEPTISGISDMERIIKTASTFRVKVAVCINKYDVNIKNTEKIMEYCHKHDIAYAGIIPYDPDAVKATNQGLSIAEFDCAAGRAVREVFEKTTDILSGV